MEVFIVEYGYDYEGDVVVGVYSTREIADKVANEIKHRGDYINVTSYVVDE